MSANLKIDLKPNDFVMWPTNFREFFSSGVYCNHVLVRVVSVIPKTIIIKQLRDMKDYSFNSASYLTRSHDQAAKTHGDFVRLASSAEIAAGIQDARDFQAAETAKAHATLKAIKANQAALAQLVAELAATP